MTQSTHIPDSAKTHWVNRSPLSLRPYFQLSRLDRPAGYWLLALPGWIGLSFATLSHGFAMSDLKWAALILIGAIAMRGAGCTYNDIVDQDLDIQVERTALRPLPAGTVTTKQAWIWTFAQCFVGLMVLLCLPRLAQIIALCSLPLVAAYPFMKRITWWPQVWLGMTFNWAVFVAYAAKTGDVTLPLLMLYVGLIFWTIGYDTIYACQDIEDDAMIGVKSSARGFGKQVRLAVSICYLVLLVLLVIAISMTLPAWHLSYFNMFGVFIAIPFAGHLVWQIKNFHLNKATVYLKLFKSNLWAGLILSLSLCASAIFLS